MHPQSHNIFCRWDIIAERLGFMLIFGDLVWIPFTFSIQVCSLSTYILLFLFCPKPVQFLVFLSPVHFPYGWPVQNLLTMTHLCLWMQLCVWGGQCFSDPQIIYTQLEPLQILSTFRPNLVNFFKKNPRFFSAYWYI